MKSIIFSVFVLLLVSVWCSAQGVGNTTCSPNKVLFNYQLASQLMEIRNLLIHFKKPYIHVKGKLVFPGPDAKSTTVLENTKIYNMTLLQNIGNAYVWTGANDMMYGSFSLGLVVMNVSVGTMKFSGKTYKNQMISLRNVTIAAMQQMITAKNSCIESIGNITIQKVENASWFQGKAIKDLTQYVNDIVLPNATAQLNNAAVSNLTQLYFNKCNMSSTVNFLNLLKTPYASDASATNLLSSTIMVIISILWFTKFSFS